MIVTTAENTSSITITAISNGATVTVAPVSESPVVEVNPTALVSIPAAFETRVSDLEKSGWIYFVNTTHTELNPYTFQGGIEFVFPLRDDNRLDSNSSEDLKTFIDNNNNNLNPSNEGDELEMRVEFLIKTNLANRRGKFNIDIGVSSRFNPRNFLGSDNASVSEPISVDFPMFVGSTFIANGGELKCTIDGSGELYDVSVYVRKIRHGEDI